jgi:hypothetical protein
MGVRRAHESFPHDLYLLKAKAKAVPLRTTKALREKGGIGLTDS